MYYDIIPLTEAELFVIWLFVRLEIDLIRSYFYLFIYF